MAAEISSPNYDKLATAAHTPFYVERVACNCMHFLVIVIKGEWICSAVLVNNQSHAKVLRPFYNRKEEKIIFPLASE